jgi:ribose 5-phosphate isomerase B
MNIAVSCDHGGFAYKEPLIHTIKSLGHSVLDLGSFSEEPVDYPEIAEAAALAVQSGRAQRAVIICGSGVGVTFVANKFKGIRASVCHDVYSAHQGVEHDDQNILCLGARVVGIEVAKELVTAFLSATFSNLERYHRRKDKVEEIERRMFK